MLRSWYRDQPRLADQLATSGYKPQSSAGQKRRSAKKRKTTYANTILIKRPDATNTRRPGRTRGTSDKANEAKSTQTQHMHSGDTHEDNEREEGESDGSPCVVLPVGAHRASSNGAGFSPCVSQKDERNKPHQRPQCRKGQLGERGRAADWLAQGASCEEELQHEKGDHGQERDYANGHAEATGICLTVVNADVVRHTVNVGPSLVRDAAKHDNGAELQKNGGRRAKEGEKKEKLQYGLKVANAVIPFLPLRSPTQVLSNQSSQTDAHSPLPQHEATLLGPGERP